MKRCLMDMRNWKKKLDVLEAHKNNMRKKIASIGGSSASKLWRELDRIEGEISKTKDVARSSSARI